MAAVGSLDPYDQKEILSDLLWLTKECEWRCMIDGSKWAAEILCYLPQKTLLYGEENADVFKEIYSLPVSSSPVADRYAIFARNLLLAKEFHRAEHFYEKAKEVDARYTYLYYYTRYLKAVSENMENDVESIERKAADVDDEEQLSTLYCELVKHNYEPDKGDCFFYYLLGCVERMLGMREMAKESFIHSVRTDQRMWPAWEELASLMEDPEEIERTRKVAGASWMGAWFEAKAMPRFHLYAQAVDRTEELSGRGFGQQPELIAHSASCCNLSNDHDSAIALYKQAFELAPYRVEEMHLYSDSLFVRQERVPLASLAHSFFRSHKFDWRTCCIVANYYSLRGEREQSVRFLQRAARLNPKDSSIWTLIGHEFMEMKNHAAACMAYRKAIEIEPTDKRGWYGLGQLYDILKMHTFAIYYYREAHKCSPNDSRMLVALGEVYQKVNRNVDAERCLLKAFKVGDVEGTALLRLARHYEGLGMRESAATVYESYLDEYVEMAKSDPAVPPALLFLTRFYETVDLDKAMTYAQKCMEYEASRHEGSTLLTQIQLQRQRKATLRSASSPKKRVTLDLTSVSAMEDNTIEEEMAVVSEGEDEDISFD